MFFQVPEKVWPVQNAFYSWVVPELSKAAILLLGKLLPATSTTGNSTNTPCVCTWVGVSSHPNRGLYPGYSEDEDAVPNQHLGRLVVLASCAVLPCSHSVFDRRFVLGSWLSISCPRSSSGERGFVANRGEALWHDSACERQYGSAIFMG